MRVKSLTLRDFKRFHDFKIDLMVDSRKIVALVGPNGSGKSSVFDAFEELATDYKGRPHKPISYYKKSLFGATPTDESYDVRSHVILDSDQQVYDRKSFYIRSAYRYTARLNVEAIKKLDDPEADQSRPKRLIDMDGRLAENYERLLGRFYDEVYGKDLTGQAWAQRNIDEINDVLKNVLDITISSLGNPVNGEGSLYFEKGSSKKFPFENLSSGEKEVLDIVIDLFVKKSIYTNSVICIDEPELHLNTAIQRKLLVELEKLISEESQLWVATHSIGFLRALQDELWGKTAVIDFTGADFDQPVQRAPIKGTRRDWMRIFETALEDLTGLMAPQQIVYCEGRADTGIGTGELGLDADIYNEAFGDGHPDTLFVSSGGGGEVRRNALVALKVLRKALSQVKFIVLKDRDDKTDAERTFFLSEDSANRMLLRREIENYLFDKQVLEAYCTEEKTNFDVSKYQAAVTDIVYQDLKPVQQKIQTACGGVGDMAAFKRALAKHLKNAPSVLRELESVIF